MTDPTANPPARSVEREGEASTQPMTWTEETMLKINRLTSGISGKAFDPDWFLLRQWLEQAELRMLNPFIARDIVEVLIDELVERETIPYGRWEILTARDLDELTQLIVKRYSR